MRLEKSKKGYTLAEMAIVLAVAGFLTASIWAAASSARASKRIAQTSQQIMTVVQRTRDYYLGTQNITGQTSGGAAIARHSDLIFALFSKDAFPAEMKARCGPNVCLNSAVSADPSGSFRMFAGSTTNHFRIVLTQLSREECVNLLSNAVNFRDQTLGVDGICVGAPARSCLGDTDLGINPWLLIDSTTTPGVRSIAGGATVMGLCNDNTLQDHFIQVGWDFNLRK